MKNNRALLLCNFVNHLNKYPLTRQQHKTLKGQVLTGGIEDSWKGPTH